jgi:hypothetical protein
VFESFFTAFITSWVGNSWTFEYYPSWRSTDLTMAVFLWDVWGRDWIHFGLVVWACSVTTLLLGSLNVPDLSSVCPIFGQRINL